MLIVVTNRKLCRDDFLQRIQKLAKGKPHAIMLREKDLNLSDYENLAIKVKEICERHQVPLIINHNISVAEKLNLETIHLSIADIRENHEQLSSFKYVGVSVHSVAEAKEAQELGASYIVAGHIFSTDCKKGIPPRGLTFLNEVCQSVTIPVYAIGGIKKDAVQDILLTGAKGVCIMSEAMACENPVELANKFKFRI